MTTKRITTGWRGFSIARESAYGVPAAVDTTFNFEGAPTDIAVQTALSDENEVTGFNEATRHEILNWKLEGVHKQRALPHNLGYLLSLVLGRVTTDQPDFAGNPTVYRHYIERELANAAPPSVTLVEHDGLSAKRYSGIYGKTVTLKGERGDFLKVEAEFGGMGKEEASAISKPALLLESYLRYGDVQFTQGGALTGTVAGGDLAVTGSPVSFAADLMSFEWKVDNQARAVYEMGDGSGFVSRVEMGDRFENELSAELEMQDDTHKSALLSGSPFVLNIPVTGSVIPGGTGAFNYLCDIVFPRVVYREAKKDVDDQALVVKAGFQVLEDPVYGSVIVKVVNEQPGYLL